MAMGLLHVITVLLSTFSSRVSRAARKLSLRSRSSLALAARGRNKNQRPAAEVEDDEPDSAISGGSSSDDGVWRRAILMGEKCQPLDFSGVIYYDADGRRLAEVPTPRSPLRSSLPSFALKDPLTAGYIN